MGYVAKKRSKQGVQGVPMSTMAAAASLSDVGNPSVAGNPSNVTNTKVVIPGTVAEITLSNYERN